MARGNTSAFRRSRDKGKEKVMRRSRLIVAALAGAGLLAGCGTSQNGGGSGTPLVQVSPSVAIVILNGTQQFAATVTGVAGQSIVSGTGAVRANNIVTITTTLAHGFSVNQPVTITGVTDVTFNGVFTIASVPSSTTFTYAQIGTDATSGGGTATNTSITWFVNDVQGGNAQFGTITATGIYTAPAAVPPATTVSITATGAVRMSNVVNITTTAAHNLVVGQTVTISGVTDSTFNGTFVVQSAPTATTFVYAQTAADASSGGGMVISTTIRIKAVSVADTSVSGTATVSIDSGVSVSVTPNNSTIGVGQTFQFSAVVNGSTNQGVNWSVNNVQGGNSTVGTISPTGLYTAPAAVPSPASVAIRATSQVDTNRSGTVTATISAATQPTLTSIFPTMTAQGAAFEDLYLAGTNFLSTSQVRVNGNAVASTLLGPTLIRSRLPEALLANAGMLTVDVLPQGGMATSAFTLTVNPVRPALVGTSPDSAPQGGGAVNVNFNGGYFSPSVTAEFNAGAPSGGVRSFTQTSSRQISVALNASDANTSGLFPVSVRNTSAAPQVAAANLAISPNVAPVVSAPIAVGAMPSGVAVNTATGIAVVANRGSNNVSLIDLNTLMVAATIAVQNAPAGVAVDELRNLALVANSGSNSVSVIDLAMQAVTSTITGFPAAPVGVTVNPQTGLGLVVMQSTNVAAIIDLASNSIVSAVAHATGLNPQAAVVPRLNWAIATPGGNGSVSIVDLARRSAPLTIAAASSGAIRSGNIVTITTTSTHSFIAGQAVHISGVADPSFNGIFLITTVPSSSTFTYSQAAANAMSGGGTVISTTPVAIANLGNGVSGAGVNTETSALFLADPTASAGIVFSALDQSVTNIPLGTGNVASAVNPLTNIGVTVNPLTDVVNVADLRTSQVTQVSAGTDPRAVAIDPGTNTAVVVNEGSNNVHLIALGPIRPLHITSVSPFQVISTGAAVNVTLIGSGFVNGCTVRLDETPVATTFISSRQLTATVPAAMATTAARFALDVMNPGNIRSNVTDFAVIQPIAVGTAPRGVAVNAETNTAVVANSGSNSVSVVNLATGMVTATITVGSSPQGVALFPRMNRAVVTNSGSGSASVIDLAMGSLAFNVTVGSEPLGVAVNSDTAQAIVANATTNNVSVFSVDTSSAPAAATITSEARPFAVAWDHTRNIAIIAHAAQNNVAMINFASGSNALTNRLNIQQPLGVTYDAVADRFVAISSLGNSLLLVDPATGQGSTLRTGINPTSLAYNPNAATLVTANTATDTLTVMDMIDRRVRAILPLHAASRFAVAIHPFSNLAVVSDETNNRILLVPLPR
jgi:YVTN family beta-propeller protein